ncbi:MAG: uncharacterized protein A8A55_1115 [Amphiamblys sp. WSBS2006]|nr:MAG: uncharacterized protein A8A55_1115 [Amphiamblys sp. WSBS2006]
MNFEFDETVSLPEDTVLRITKKVANAGTKQKPAKLLLRENTSHGSLICELGQNVVHTDDLAVLSPYLFFLGGKENLVLDYRTSTLPSKHIRWACRPNTAVKKTVIGDTRVRWYLFAVGSLQRGTELFLPSDYRNGNKTIHRKCSCGRKDACLFQTCPKKMQLKKLQLKISLQEYMKVHALKQTSASLGKER